MSLSASEGMVEDDEDVDVPLIPSPTSSSASSPELNIFDVKSDIWSSSGPLSLLLLLLLLQHCSFRVVIVESAVWGTFNVGRLLYKVVRFRCWWRSGVDDDDGEEEEDDDEDVKIDSASWIVDEEQGVWMIIS